MNDKFDVKNARLHVKGHIAYKISLDGSTFKKINLQQYFIPAFVSLIHFVLCCPVLSRSVVSQSLRPHGLQHTRLLSPRGFSSQEYLSGLPCPSLGDCPNPGIEPGSPAVQVDSLPSEPSAKPMNTGVGGLSLLQGIFLTQKSN